MSAFQYSVKFCGAIRPEQEATRGQEGSAIKLGAGRVELRAAQAQGFSCVTTALFLKDKQPE